jgi:phage shock protein C
MYCPNCGKDISKKDSFCVSCGSPVVVQVKEKNEDTFTNSSAHAYPTASSDSNTLYRSKQDKMLAGVCAGLGKHFNLDIGLTRALFVLIFLFTSGTILIVYIVLALVIPEES